MGSSREIRFWEDQSIGDRPLREAYRNLYSLAMDPMDRVSNVFDEESSIWRPRMLRNLNDCEFGELGNLLALLDGIKPNPSVGDSWVWIL